MHGKALSVGCKLKRNWLIILTSVVALYIFLNPLRRSEISIRKYLLNQTPLGTTFSAVRDYVEAEGWGVTMSSTRSGYIRRDIKPSVVVGSQYLRTSIGEYQGFPFAVDVTAFWGFDDDGELVDIWIWKTANGF